MLKPRDKPCARCCHSSHPAHNHETRLNTASAKSRRDKTSLTGRLHRLSKGVFKHQPLWGLAGLLHANAPMTTYESREIKGWRTRRDEEGERLASAYWVTSHGSIASTDQKGKQRRRTGQPIGQSGRGRTRQRKPMTRVSNGGSGNADGARSSHQRRSSATRPQRLPA